MEEVRIILMRGSAEGTVLPSVVIKRQIVLGSLLLGRICGKSQQEEGNKLCRFFLFSLLIISSKSSKP